MRHTDEEIERAAKRFDLLADELDPATAQVLRADGLREVAAASEAVRTNESQLREAVEIARAHGRSFSSSECRSRAEDCAHPQFCLSAPSAAAPDGRAIRGR